MCGIIGLWSTTQNHSHLQDKVYKGASIIAHRGPDSQGFWSDIQENIILGHRRLSIIDLSDAGTQPMLSHDKRFVITYNGEIYNFLELKEKLEKQTKRRWKGHSDTEVLLECFSSWGIEKTLKQVDGMFAIALWDQKNKTLTLARDRAGEKPLYYGLIDDGTLFFGSELKSIFAMGIKPPIDPLSLGLYLKFHYVPNPKSILKNIYKLSPGTYMTINSNILKSKNFLHIHYWNPIEHAIQAHELGWNGSLKEFMDKSEELLITSIKRRMISDVPLGAFLSGGIDSSLITGIMQKISQTPIRTYSIGFKDKNYDESSHAKEVADFLGTKHTSLMVTPQELLNVIEKIPEIWDEPFADSSQIPTYFLSKLTKQHITVAMSGDAGDELTGGYNRYLYSLILYPLINKQPTKLMGHFLILLTNSVSKKITHLYLKKLLYKVNKLSLYIEKSNNFKELYENFFGGWINIPINTSPPPSPYWHDADPLLRFGVLPYMQLHDFLHYLSDDILVKVDRASMSVSLETRIPFLEPNFLQFMWRMPASWRIRGITNKWLLRQLAYKHIPKKLLNRPKQGFSVPIGDWLKKELLDWTETLISKNAINEHGFFEYQQIKKTWEEHKVGIVDRSYPIWNIVMFQSWYNKWYK